MAASESVLKERARRAYEMGRVHLGLRRAAAVVPMAVVSLLLCGRPAATAIAAALLATLVVAAEWRGQAVGRGARIGLWGGVPPLLLPLLVQATDQVCGTSFCRLFPAVCLIGGLAGGVLVAAWGLRRGMNGYGLATAGLAAGLAGTLGCLVAGAAGVMGLALGLGLGATPLLVLRRA